MSDHKHERSSDEYLDENLTVEDAAQFLKVTTAMLKTMRLNGRGPRYRRFSYNTVVYSRRALLSFAESHEFSSTSDDAVLRRSREDDAPPASDDSAGSNASGSEP